MEGQEGYRGKESLPLVTPVDNDGKARAPSRRPDDAQHLSQVSRIGRNKLPAHSRTRAALTPVLPSLAKGAQPVGPLVVAVTQKHRPTGHTTPRPGRPKRGLG